MDSSVVVKVKYGDKLRRFTAAVNENQILELGIEGLRAKIRSLFNFTADTELDLTYEDEDQDIVALVDEEDLQDIIKQCLDPVRITLQIKTGSSASVRSIGTSTPVHAQTDIQSGVAELLKTVPEPFRGHLSKLSAEVASSSRILAEFIEDITKAGNSFFPPPRKPTIISSPMYKLDIGTSSKEDASRTTGACPFSGLGMPQNSVPKAVGSQSSVFHRGVQCHGCGAHPITGPRFKSKVKENYDLCQICFEQMGKDSDYTRINLPQHHYHFKNNQVDASISEATSTTLPNSLNLNLPPDVTADNLPEMRDTPLNPPFAMIHIPPHLLPPNPQGRLKQFHGDNTSPLNGWPISEPEFGFFSSEQGENQMVKQLQDKPSFEDHHGNKAWKLGPSSSSAPLSLPGYCPISSLPPGPPLPPGPVAQYHYWGTGLLSPTHPPPPPAASAVEEPAGNTKSDVEEVFLKELEKMGFKQVEMNKRVLRKNGYDFDKSLDELCNVYDWDHL